MREHEPIDRDEMRWKKNTNTHRIKITSNDQSKNEISKSKNPCTWSFEYFQIIFCREKKRTPHITHKFNCGSLGICLSISISLPVTFGEHHTRRMNVARSRSNNNNNHNDDSNECWEKITLLLMPVWWIWLRFILFALSFLSPLEKCTMILVFRRLNSHCFQVNL